jgi:hypothetical protein
MIETCSTSDIIRRKINVCFRFKLVSSFEIQFILTGNAILYHEYFTFWRSLSRIQIEFITQSLCKSLLNTVISENNIILDVTPCTMVEVYQRFGAPLPPSSGSNSKTRMQSACITSLLHLEDGSSIVLPNVGELVAYYTASHPRR